jgi:hypothetical protein
MVSKQKASSQPWSCLDQWDKDKHTNLAAERKKAKLLDSRKQKYWTRKKAKMLENGKQNYSTGP